MPRTTFGEVEMSRFCSNLDYDSIDAVRMDYPDAAEIIEVEGGWHVFDTVTDADTWRAQA